MERDFCYKAPLYSDAEFSCQNKAEQAIQNDIILPNTTSAIYGRIIGIKMMQ